MLLLRLLLWLFVCIVVALCALYCGFDFVVVAGCVRDSCMCLLLVLFVSCYCCGWVCRCCGGTYGLCLLLVMWLLFAVVVAGVVVIESCCGCWCCSLLAVAFVVAVIDAGVDDVDVLW